MATPINIIPASLFTGAVTDSGTNNFDLSGSSGTFATTTGAHTLNGNITFADSKVFTSTWNGNTTTNAWISQQNNTASTSGQMEWSPFQEFIGHGWSYLPGVTSSTVARTSGAAPWTITVTTTANHNLSSGINLILNTTSGDGYFVAGTYGPITVTGSTTFTYTTSTGASSGGNAVSESVTLFYYDNTGKDQAVKVAVGLRPLIGQSFIQLAGNDGTQAGPEMVYYRSSTPNNGAYGEWFKFTTADPFNASAPLYTTAGVSLVVPQTDDLTPGSRLTLKPSQVQITDDHGIGFYTVPTAGIPNTGGFLSVQGSAIYNSGSYGTQSVMGAGIGTPSALWYDMCSVRGNFLNTGLGDTATPRWDDTATAPSVGTSWFSGKGFGFGPYGLYNLGGQSKFAALAAPSGASIITTGGASTSYTYNVVAVDRNGYVTNSIVITTSSGPTTLDATHFNTLNWGTVVGAYRYDVYGNAINQAQFLGSVTTNSFKDTGTPRYTSPGAGTLATPIMNTSSWSAQGGGTGVSQTYVVYAVDTDGHVGTAASGSASFGAVASLTNYWIIGWTPIGGAAYYIICRGTSVLPIAIQAQQGVQTAGGSIVAGGMTRVGTTNNCSVNVTGGHGLRVGDTITLTTTGTDITNFGSGVITVTVVNSATQFVYTFNATGGNATSSNSATLTAGPSITTSSFTDYGYPTRTIGSAARNSTADVNMDGRLSLQSPTSSSRSALQTWADSAGNSHYGVDAFGFDSLGSKFEFRENWLMGQTLSASTNAPFTGGVWAYNSSANATGGTSTAATFLSGSPIASGLRMGTGTASGNGITLSMSSALFNPAGITNSYAILEFPLYLTAVGANNATFRIGMSNIGLGNAHPKGYYFSKTSSDTVWQCNCDDGTTTNTAPSGVAPVANTIQIMRIEYYGAGTALGTRTAVFKIDGVTVATLTSNVYNGDFVVVTAQATATATITQLFMGIGPVLMQYNMVASPQTP